MANLAGSTEAKKQLQNLGIIKNARVAIMNRDSHNGVVLIHNSRVALDTTLLAMITVSKELVGKENLKTLSDVKPGQTAMVQGILTADKDDDLTAHRHNEALKRRLLDMGVTRGTRIFVRKVAPLGDPMELHVRGYELTLRKNEAEKVEVSVLANG
ncbi:ferrous iron transporter A [Lactococcus insecticola]|uniref:Ferrous iron transporter A n=1 Tax=Pseudolactococcus insecticola TaxID=2709158 RepID=A0A6A0B7H3_9LACT|nr:ferrous iron transporter A [Lactococcus insecticola]